MGGASVRGLMQPLLSATDPRGPEQLQLFHLLCSLLKLNAQLSVQHPNAQLSTGPVPYCLLLVRVVACQALDGAGCSAAAAVLWLRLLGLCCMQAETTSSLCDLLLEIGAALERLEPGLAARGLDVKSSLQRIREARAVLQGQQRGGPPGVEALRVGQAVLSRLATPHACNNPSCINTSGASERLLVSGRSCVCGGCRVAHYCGRACQRKHWKQHKPVCEGLQTGMLLDAVALYRTECASLGGASCE